MIHTTDKIQMCMALTGIHSIRKPSLWDHAGEVFPIFTTKDMWNWKEANEIVHCCKNSLVRIAWLSGENFLKDWTVNRWILSKKLPNGSCNPINSNGGCDSARTRMTSSKAPRYILFLYLNTKSVN